MLKEFSKEGQFECGVHDIIKGRTCAFVPVTQQGPTMACPFGLGVAVANEPGYYAIPAYWCRSDNYDEMYRHAMALNKEFFDLDEMSSNNIIASTMRGKVGAK